MSLIKVEESTLLGLTELAEELTDLKDNTFIHIQSGCILVENIEKVKPEIFLKYSHENQYFYTKSPEAPSRLYIVNSNRNNSRILFDEETPEANISGSLFYEYFVFDPITFVKNTKDQLVTGKVTLNYAVSKIEELIKKIIVKSYAKDDNEDNLIKKIKTELNYQLDEAGLKVDNISIAGFVALFPREEKKEEPKEDDDEIILDMTGTNEANDEIIIDGEETDIFAEPVPEKPRCKNCGYVPEGKVPKFCPECGTKFS